MEEGRAMFNGWIWPHVMTCRHAVPLMVSGKSGLIVEIVEQETIDFHGQFFFDLVEVSLKRVAYVLAEELAPHGVAALAITPGFMRTEAILERFVACKQCNSSIVANTLPRIGTTLVSNGRIRRCRLFREPVKRLATAWDLSLSSKARRSMHRACAYDVQRSVS